MIRTIQNKTKVIIILLMINYFGEAHEVFAAKSNLKLNYKATNITCNGKADGTILLDVKGGNGPYHYIWSDGNIAPNRELLKAGNYVVTVTDQKGNSATQTINLTEPYELAIHAETTPESCYSRNAGARILVTGGTQPYEYEWSNNTRLQNLEQVAAGDYEVKVTDALGCIKIANLNIDRKKDINVQVAKYNPLCAGDDNGLIDIEVKGGWAPYSYAWSNGATTEDVSGLKAGNYSVVVNDNNGCAATLNIKLDNPEPISINASITEADMNKSNGSIELQVTGGFGNYSYLWSNMEDQAVLKNVDEGVYAVRVTDGHQCMQAAYFTVNEKSPIQITSIVKHVLCNGSNTGSISLKLKGGIEPYSYQWSNGRNGAAVSGLSAGVYTVSIMDASGKKNQASFTIQQPESMGVFATVKDESVAGKADGSINLKIIGGMMPYNYTWSSGQHRSDIQSLKPGIYTVMITDGNSCQMKHEVLVSTETTLPASSIMMRQMESTNDDNSILVYPNPFGNTFTLRFKNSVEEIQKIELFNIEGKMIQVLDLNSTRINANEISVNSQSIIPGNYLIKIKTLNKTYTKLITRSM